MGEGGDLVGEGTATSCFGVATTALDFVFGGHVSYLGFFVTKDGFEVHFAELGLVGEDFATGFESGNLSVVCLGSGMCEKVVHLV